MNEQDLGRQHRASVCTDEFLSNQPRRGYDRDSRLRDDFHPYHDKRRRSALPSETIVMLSADVDSRLRLARQFLEQGQGAAFQANKSGLFQPLRWHLHAFEPPPWPVSDWRSNPAAPRPPDNYACHHPTESWVIEELSS
jgi:hypothetical protein